MLEGLSDAWLGAPESPRGWSPRDIACHLADLEQDGWMPRLKTMLQYGTDRVLPGIDRERFRDRYSAIPMTVVLADFRRYREKNLRSLEALRLDPDQLHQVGRHHVLGEVRLSQLLSAWVVHDLTHLAQISRALASQYRAEVGPWTEFLSILRPPQAGSASSGGAVTTRPATDARPR